MQIAAETTNSQSLPSATLSESSVTFRQSRFSQHRVIRCNGAVVSFEPSEISSAVTKVLVAVDGVQGAASAKLQTPVIDDGLRKFVDLGCRTGSATSWDRLIGLIG